MTWEEEGKHVFVLMPFRPEFDDVYMVIKDACADEAVGPGIRCHRADESEKPGRISGHIIEAIRNADALVADLTDNNPNVMYEMGYAHALGKPTVILNQSVEKSPFDLLDFRQIPYDRSRLMRDCRPRLVTALSEVLGQRAAVEIGEERSDTQVISHGREGTAVVRQSPLIPSVKLVAEIQTLHLKLEVANMRSDVDQLQKLADELLALVDRVTVVGSADSADLHNTVGTIGNCAVELERGELFQQAEDLYKRAIGLCADYAGVHMQYADFLADRGRAEEAVAELNRGRELAPDDPRVPSLEAKVARKTGRLVDPTIGERLRVRFEEDKTSDEAAASYLLFLSETNASIDEFESVCREWEEALPEERKKEALRALADELAEKGQHERAREIYEELLPQLEGEQRAHVLHNLATVCDNLNDRDKAETYWTEAYELNPGSPVVRAAFSQRLARWGKLELALRVSSGEPLA